MKISKYSAAIGAMLLFAGVADAQAEEAGSAVWNGLTLGIGGGASYLNAEESRDSYIDDYYVNLANFYTQEDGTNDAGAFGAFGTIEAGYNMQAGGAVVGLSANYDMGKSDQDRHDNLACFANAANCIANYDSELKIGNRWAVGGRVGVLATESVLLFASGGYTQAKVNASATLEGDHHPEASDYWAGADILSDSYSGWKSGYYVGGGVEAALSSTMSLKVEYRYTDLGSISLSDDISTDPDGESGMNAELSNDFKNITDQQIRATIAVHF